MRATLAIVLEDYFLLSPSLNFGNTVRSLERPNS